MGKFLSKTLLILALLMNPAFADGFSFKKTFSSGWSNEADTIGIINNPEDDYALVHSRKLGIDGFCYPTTKKDVTAAFSCDGKALRFRYASGILYANDLPFKRIN